MKRKRDENLNNRIQDSSRKRTFTMGKMKILFHTSAIKRAIIRMVNRKDTAYVVGCVAWLSNKDILKAMAKKRGCCIVCTKDRINTKTKKSPLKPAYPGGAIRIVGEGSGWHKSLMHHKFLIGLDTLGKPLWCTNGSFNMTESALTNLENLTIMEDETIAQCYFDEFKRVHAVSK